MISTVRLFADPFWRRDRAASCGGASHPLEFIIYRHSRVTRVPEKTTTGSCLKVDQ